MCGIVGVAGSIGRMHEDVMENLLVMDAVRGVHSVGVAAVNRYAHQEVTVYKAATDPLSFLDSKRWASIRNKTTMALIGHNRQATKGVVNNMFAHPFEHGHITGVHNGTLLNQALLLDHNMFDVDSDNIFYSISQVGVEETWKNINGAAALVWWDSSDNSLNMLRNSQRPLFYNYSEDGKVLLFSSEWTIAWAAAARNSFKLQPKFIALPENQLHTWILPTANTAIPEPVVRDVVPFVSQVQTTRVFSSVGGHVRSEKGGKDIFAKGDTIFLRVDEPSATVYNHYKAYTDVELALDCDDVSSINMVGIIPDTFHNQLVKATVVDVTNTYYGARVTVNVASLSLDFTDEEYVCWLKSRDWGKMSYPRCVCCNNKIGYGIQPYVDGLHVCSNCISDSKTQTFRAMLKE